MHKMDPQGAAGSFPVDPVDFLWPLFSKKPQRGRLPESPGRSHLAHTLQHQFKKCHASAFILETGLLHVGLHFHNVLDNFANFFEEKLEEIFVSMSDLEW